MKPTKTLLVANKFILGIAVFWTLSIAFLCLVDLHALPDLPDLKVSGMDKYVHFSFHFGFTLLWSYCFIRIQKELIIKTVLNVFYVSVSYGILIEILQSVFTTTRKGDIMDVLANTTGASIAVITLLFYAYFKKAKTKKQIH